MSATARELEIFDCLGSMPFLPAAWEVMPVQQDVRAPLAPGHRWPLTAYQQIGIEEVSYALASEWKRGGR